MASTETLEAPRFATASERSVAKRWRLGPSIRNAVLLLLALAGGVFGWRELHAPRGSTLRYQTAKVDRGAILAKVSANGTLSALVTVNVGSQVSGRVQTLLVDFGSTVKEGQVVATIEPSMFRAAAAQAAANLQAAQSSVLRAKAQKLNAEKQLARTTALHGEGLTTSAEYETAQASLAVAAADLDLAQANVSQARAARDQTELNLHYTTIVSPIDGIVISRNVDAGQTVAATLQAPTLFTIARDLTHMQVDTNVAEADVGKVHAGMDVTFTIDAYPSRVFHGRLRQVRDNAQTIQNVVTYDAVVDVENPEHLLKPGMTASVTFPYAHQADAIRVSNAALRFRPDPSALTEMLDGHPVLQLGASQRSLWLLRGGKPVTVPIRTGISDGTFTEVVEGDVKPGDQMVIEAQSNGDKRSP
jgi:HlyD family secretion protein